MIFFVLMKNGFNELQVFKEIVLSVKYVCYFFLYRKLRYLYVKEV